MRTLLTLSVIYLSACRGPAGADGTNGQDGLDGLNGQDGAAGAAGQDGQDALDGQDGLDGQNGKDGQDGQDGTNGLGVEIDSFHGAEYMQAADLAEGKFLADATIDSATAATDGTVTVDFAVADKDGLPVTGITSINATIAKLEPASKGESFNKWVSYIYQKAEVTGSKAGDWPNPDGTAADQAYREGTGTLTDHGDGTYTYVFATDISAVVTPVEKTAITYDRSLTHRVAIEMGGSSSATADATFDFVPDGSAITETRNIIDTAACQECHGTSFAAHGGDRLTVEDCVTCHQPDNWDPQGGETVDFKVMIHKIHSGSDLPTIAGTDGQVWDDPETSEDETADNGTYAIWGYGDEQSTWWEVGFPAEIANCTKCHSGTGEDVENWREVPSRDACGSCHNDIDFSTGVNHPGGEQDSDDNCTVCHEPTHTGKIGRSITDAHDFANNDLRNISEFTLDVSMSAPLNGVYYDTGEAPELTIVINKDGAPIDHTTVTEDTDGAEGCVEGSTTCEGDGMFDHVYLMVSGPRDERAPVLTTPARLEVVSTSSGPFDISPTDATIDFVFDGGQDIKSTLETKSATVSVAVADGTFVDTSAATVDELVTWLNANTDFFNRAWAYKNTSGMLAIRGRKLGTFPAIETTDTDTDLSVTLFGSNTTKTLGGTYVKADIKQFTSSSSNDVNATWNTDSITYQLDAVDDLTPGTYIVSMEVADAGKIDDDNYRTASIVKHAFQVKQADEELAPAGNCDTCHENAVGDGMVFDNARHHKVLDETAVDQCGACHDYTDRDTSGEAWGGAYPIARRVHALHYGAYLNYPLDTVGHDDDPEGRYWNIEFPQDVRYCDQTCHQTATTSGSWKTQPARVPCMGCHDSDSATAHMTIMTWDPTPDSPWSGDEQEACDTCHAAADE